MVECKKVNRMETKLEHKATEALAAADGSALRVEAWECRRCGKAAPCRIEITYDPTPYPHVEKQSRFRNRQCLAAEPGLIPEWKRMPNRALCDGGRKL